MQFIACGSIFAKHYISAEEYWDEILKLVKEVKEKFPTKTIWMYTGFLWESIKDLEIMNYIDVLVDGEFEVDKKDVQLFWRGSANQRVIDVPKTKESGEVVLHCE